MVRLVAVAFVLAVATSAQAMSPAPLHQPDGMTTQARPSPPTPTVRLERPRSGTHMGLSTMRGKWHLHVEGTSPGPPPGQPQVLRIRLRYRTEPGGHNNDQKTVMRTVAGHSQREVGVSLESLAAIRDGSASRDWKARG